MANKLRFLPPILAVFLFMGISISNVCAGPAPKECAPLAREIYVTLGYAVADPAFRANLCAEGFRYASWYELKRCNETLCVYREDLGQPPLGGFGGYPHTPSGSGGAIAETCWGYAPGKNYARIFAEFEWRTSEFSLDQVVTPDGYDPVCEAESRFWCISE